MVHDHPEAFIMNDGEWCPRLGTVWRKCLEDGCGGVVRYVVGVQPDSKQAAARKRMVRLALVTSSINSTNWLLSTLQDGVSLDGCSVEFVGMGTAPRAVCEVTSANVEAGLLLPQSDRLQSDPLAAEQLMREADAREDYWGAKSIAVKMPDMWKKYTTQKAEEAAVDENRVLVKDALGKLSKPDQMCWRIRGLHEFEIYRQLSGYYWYE